MTKAEEFGSDHGSEPYRMIATGPMVPVKHTGDGAIAARILGEPQTFLVPDDIWMVYDDDSAVSMTDGKVVTKFDYSRIWNKRLN